MERYWECGLAIVEMATNEELSVNPRVFLRGAQVSREG